MSASDGADPTAGSNSAVAAFIMAIGYDFRQARRFVEEISDDDREKLTALCRSIQGAEARLLDAAAPLMERCAAKCRGICCRNIQIDAVIGRGDLVYILALNPRLAPEMAACLENEPLLYAADCVFLKNGVGPCIFPDTLKPDVCLTTFCEDTDVAAREIRMVKRRFMRLDLYIMLYGLRRLARWLGSTLRLSSPDAQNRNVR